MFASLGGEESWTPKRKRRDSDDEFGLGGLKEDEGFGVLNVDSSGVIEILDRYPIPMEGVSQLEGEEKSQATSELYRKNAIRATRLSAWSREQCASVMLEFQECFRSTKIKIPFISCAAEESAYHHCLDVTRRAVKDETKNYHSRQANLWQELHTAPPSSDPNSKPL